MTETVSAVLVPVPEAERVVSRHRVRMETFPNANWDAGQLPPDNTAWLLEPAGGA